MTHSLMSVLSPAVIPHIPQGRLVRPLDRPQKRTVLSLYAGLPGAVLAAKAQMRDMAAAERLRKKRLAQQEYRRNNPDKVLASKLRWERKFPRKAKALKSAWYEKNRDRLLEYQRQYTLKNKDRIAARRKQQYDQKKRDEVFA